MSSVVHASVGLSLLPMGICWLHKETWTPGTDLEMIVVLIDRTTHEKIYQQINLGVDSSPSTV